MRVSNEPLARARDAFAALLASRRLNFLVDHGAVYVDPRLSDLPGSEGLLQLLAHHVASVNLRGFPRYEHSSAPTVTTSESTDRPSRGTRWFMMATTTGEDDGMDEREQRLAREWIEAMEQYEEEHGEALDRIAATTRFYNYRAFLMEKLWRLLGKSPPEA